MLRRTGSRGGRVMSTGDENTCWAPDTGQLPSWRGEASMTSLVDRLVLLLAIAQGPLDNPCPLPGDAEYGLAFASGVCGILALALSVYPRSRRLESSNQAIPRGWRGLLALFAIYGSAMAGCVVVALGGSVNDRLSLAVRLLQSGPWLRRSGSWCYAGTEGDTSEARRMGRWMGRMARSIVAMPLE